MSIHFWLKSESVPMTLEAISALSDDKARFVLAKMRWGFDDKQICPILCGR
jgi:hypothetical protein